MWYAFCQAADGSICVELIKINFNKSCPVLLAMIHIPEYLSVIYSRKIHINALFCIISMLPDTYCGKFVCRTGQAYSKTSLTTLAYTLAGSVWLILVRFNWYNNVQSFPSLFLTIFSWCLFQTYYVWTEGSYLHVSCKIHLQYLRNNFEKFINKQRNYMYMTRKSLDPIR